MDLTLTALAYTARQRANWQTQCLTRLEHSPYSITALKQSHRSIERQRRHNIAVLPLLWTAVSVWPHWSRKWHTTWRRVSLQPQSFIFCLEEVMPSLSDAPKVRDQFPWEMEAHSYKQGLSQMKALLILLHTKWTLWVICLTVWKHVHD